MPSSSDPQRTKLPEQIEAVKGGLWTDANLNQSLDWQGEVTGDQADVDETKTYIPRTTKEQEEDILSENSIGPEVVSVIAKRVEERLMKAFTQNDAAVHRMIQQEMNKSQSHLDRWMDDQSRAFQETVKTYQDGVKSTDIIRLDEKIRSLEKKMDTLLATTTIMGAETVEMIQEAHKIISDRRDIEGLDTTSNPSILNKFDDAAQNVTTLLSSLKPYTADASTAAATVNTQVRTARSKFGRRG